MGTISGLGDDLKTVLSKANTNSPSLRTTVPLSIVEQFDLKVGDNLDWKLDLSGGRLRVLVEPVKK